MYGLYDHYMYDLPFVVPLTLTFGVLVSGPKDLCLSREDGERVHFVL